MKTIPTRHFPFEVGNGKVKATIELEVCPFCDEPLQNPPDLTRSFISRRPHTAHRCANWVDESTVWFRGDEDMAVGFFVDPDGDWWVFEPDHNYELVDHYLKPIKKSEIRDMLSDAIVEHTRTLDNAKRALMILANTETV